MNIICNMNRKAISEIPAPLDCLVKCSVQPYTAKVEQCHAQIDWIDKHDPWVEYWRKEIHGFHWGLAFQSFLMACGIVGLVIGGRFVFSLVINH